MIPHYSYDLGYISFGGFFDSACHVCTEVDSNYAVNVMLVDYENYDRFCEGESYDYYGGYVEYFPYNITIPHKGYWKLVIDNGGDDMDGIETKVFTHEHCD